MPAHLRVQFDAMIPRLRAEEGLVAIMPRLAGDPMTDADTRRRIMQSMERTAYGEREGQQRVDVPGVLANVAGLGIPVEIVKREE